MKGSAENTVPQIKPSCSASTGPLEDAAAPPAPAGSTSRSPAGTPGFFPGEVFHQPHQAGTNNASKSLPAGHLLIKELFAGRVNK